MNLSPYNPHLIGRDTTRTIEFKPNINPYAAGSVLASFGQTQIHVTAVIDDATPPWLKGKGKGWVTAEYAMLPSATHQRVSRERKGVSGRSQEIQRLIGRSLRSIIDLSLLGERQILIDCDVIVADGGTRTASISGAYLALAMAVKKLMDDGKILKNPLKGQLAAISLGLNKEGKVLADLNYEEDSACEADVNVVLTKEGKIVEVQATAEGDPFSIEQLSAIIDTAQKALSHVFKKQDEILKNL